MSNVYQIFHIYRAKNYIPSTLKVYQISLNIHIPVGNTIFPTRNYIAGFVPHRCQRSRGNAHFAMFEHPSRLTAL